MALTVPEHTFELSSLENKKPKPNPAPPCSVFQNCSSLLRIFPSTPECKYVIVFSPSMIWQLTALWGTLHRDPKLAVSNFRCSKAFMQHSYQLLLHIKSWEPKARPKSHTFAGQQLKTTSSKKHKPYPSPSPQPTTSQKFITYCRLGV